MDAFKHNATITHTDHITDHIIGRSFDRRLINCLLDCVQSSHIADNNSFECVLPDRIAKHISSAAVITSHPTEPNRRPHR
ncbi:hypothetical protein ASPCAL14824 [Aspergillus calidoustus]|uniref:Uncharacterized protein n=1 Tax=Aspergillus calidoustus TaxID=454130 RepID=A0A0U5GNZ4_ASPCI|nr:hypothetical protein ASPCAL14824 [Aspergillus calidoustus]